MTLRSLLAASYARFAKRPLRRPPYADELLWLPAWLVAVPLARLGTPPEAVVVAGFACGLGAVAIIAGGGLPEHAPLCAALILANAVLDSVDGGVAINGSSSVPKRIGSDAGVGSASPVLSR